MSNNKIIKSISAKKLQELKLEKLYAIVENLLHQGFSVLAGAPKIGKSWISIDLAISVATGQTFLGFATNKSSCIYLALEDSPNRLQDRLNKILNGKPAPENLKLAVNCSTLDNGLIEELENYMKEYPDTKLIIIDTLQKVRGTQHKSDSSYSYDYREIGKLKTFADIHKICILVIHHLRKMKDSDVFNQISGSTGLTGAADTMMVIDKIKNRDSEVLFSLTGRDVESLDKTLTFNKDLFKWEVIYESKDLEVKRKKDMYENNPTVVTIKKLVNDNPKGIKITSSDLLKKIVEITGTFPKQQTPQTLSREINTNLQFLLLKYDRIHYSQANKNGGSSGRTMYFSKPSIVLEQIEI